jgi:hypothetical protein
LGREIEPEFIAAAIEYRWRRAQFRHAAFAPPHLAQLFESGRVARAVRGFVALIRLQEDDNAEGLFGGFAGTGDRNGTGWRFAA